MRLPIRVSPEPTEGIWGWALRAAEANSYPNPATILRMAGYLPPTRPRAVVISALAEAAGVDEEKIEPLVPLQRGSGTALARLPHVNAPGALLDLRSVRICPICVRQNGLLPAIWDLVFWTACPWHRTRMITNCPRCGDAYTWNRPHIDRCHNIGCRCKISDQNPSEADAADLILPRFVAQAMGHDNLPDDCNINECFEFPDASEAIRIIFRIGNIAGRSENIRTHISNVCKTASNIFCDWPTAFHAAYRSAYKESNASNADHIPFHNPKRVLRWRSKHLISPVSENIIAKEVVKSVGRDSIRKYKFNDLANIKSREIQFVPRKTAARLLKVSEATVDYMYKNGTLRGHEEPGGGKRCLRMVNIADIEAIISSDDYIRCNRDKYYSISELNNETGISPTYARLLNEKGILRLRKFGNGIYAEKILVSGFLLQLIQKSAPIIDSDIDSEMHVPINKMKRKFDLEIDYVVRAIMNDNIHPDYYSQDSLDLRKMYFLRDNILLLSENFWNARGAVLRSRAAIMLGVPKVHIQWLVESSLISEVNAISVSNYPYICADSLRVFKEKYVPSVYLSRCINDSIEQVGQSLVDYGLSPMVMKSRTTSYSYWNWCEVIDIFPQAARWRRIYSKSDAP